jgi:hypothetical protein
MKHYIIRRKIMAEKKKKKPVKKTATKAKDKPKKEKTAVTAEVKVQEVTEPVVVVPNLAIEPNNSGAPKNFVIRCPKCSWSRISSGLKVDLTDINEIKPNCATCGKHRKFQCMKCGAPAHMKRIRGNT